MVNEEAHALQFVYLGPPIHRIASGENGPTCDIANPIKWNGLRMDPPAISILFSLVILSDPRDRSVIVTNKAWG